MDHNTVRLNVGCLRGVLGLVLSALLVAGCHSTHQSQSDYVDIPELPGTPVGTPVASTPSNSAPAVSAPAPELSAPAPALSTSVPVESSSDAKTQVVAPISTDSGPATTKVTQTHASPAEGETKSGDIIRTGEMIHIVFSDTPQTIPPVDDKVKDDGTITLMFDRTLKAAGKTPGELAKDIRRTYVPDYFAQMTATVIRDVMRTFYVDGEVKAPSKQPYTGPITVSQAITSAGGFTDFANKRKVRLTRANGKIEMINCKELMDHPEKDPEVYPGDKVYVPRSWL
jgi:protein involved in polysaccharide export with SLBB domain